MKNQPESTQDDVIRSWHDRAYAYDKLIRRWPIFTSMADQLLECLSGEFDGHALDIAGGTGLLTERLLSKHPKSHVTLAEPASNMRDIATRRLGDNVDIKDASSDTLDTLDITADTAFCSASFHLMDENTTLPSVSLCLRQGSLFATNLWGHSFDEAKDMNQKIDWIKFVDQALDDFGQLPLHRSNPSTHKIKNANELEKIGKTCGLDLIEVDISTVEIDTKFNIEFAAMSDNFLNHIERSLRQPIIDRALQMCCGVDVISMVDLKFEKI